MALKSVHWVFYNEDNANEKIVVQDNLSAGVLAEVLKTHKDVWVMKEEYAASLVTAPSASQVAPKAEVTRPGITRPEMIRPEVTRPEITKPDFSSANLARPQGTPPPLRAPVKAAERAEERRTQKRYSVDLRIILISKGRSFRSISQDVSLGGMKLKNKVPAEFSGQECVAYISNAESKENIEMVCQVIADPNDPRRVQFVNADAQQLKRLNKWLSDHQVVVKKAG